MFGDTTLCEEEYSLPIRYTGQYNDNETNLYYLNARYYNVNTGRFLTKDTYAGQDNNTLSLNRYTYCYNNPINNYDPTGHFAQALGGLGELASEILPELGPVGAGILAVGVTSYDTMSSYDGDKDMSTFFPDAQSANPKSVDDYISIFPSSAEASESHIIIDYGNPEKSINDFLETFEPHVKSVDDYIISDDFTAGRDVSSIIIMIEGGGEASEEFVTLYHGTSKLGAKSIRMNGVDLQHVNRNMDFGRGFYTTTIKEQAESWARRKRGEVIEFEIPKNELDKLNSKVFSSANGEWVKQVTDGRRGINHDYDSISGPMLSNPSQYLSGLEAAKSHGQQTTFNTQRAVDLLNKFMKR